ncbi:hypothetical protein Gobs01_03050 [Geodermatophilus obscurus DSM 43160]|uniref:Berberine/berberine domain protein n=1 Tax=Geodermatophilus obscurus (strain ATCC 25078 / DSM 43160 / JCM 3152 / CCUG 61914 / KCC A-0152 / KCTC 9177 / NBRC 13315 / NRRL B-3577 / G-20) TaxID=526225 RepID=D2SBW0_GEOOG|nr:Berberine/berberine domain protein [Geodermatophilus obscurus DSM 43160]
MAGLTARYRRRFVRGVSTDMEPLATRGQYVNFQGQELAGHRAVDARTVFGPTKYRQFVDTKRRFDPENLFHVNHNIPPK